LVVVNPTTIRSRPPLSLKDMYQEKECQRLQYNKMQKTMNMQIKKELSYKLSLMCSFSL
jgi:hypothetical protein